MTEAREDLDNRKKSNSLKYGPRLEPNVKLPRSVSPQSSFHHVIEFGSSATRNLCFMTMNQEAQSEKTI